VGGRGYGGQCIRAVILQLIFIFIYRTEFCGVHLDIGAHFAKVESIFFVTLFVAPGKVVVPCMIDESLSDTEP
jgi:hypothetical protein